MSGELGIPSHQIGLNNMFLTEFSHLLRESTTSVCVKYVDNRNVPK